MAENPSISHTVVSSCIFFLLSSLLTPKFDPPHFHNFCVSSARHLAQKTHTRSTASVSKKGPEKSVFRLEDEGLRDDAIIVGGAFNAQLHETDLLSVRSIL